MNLSKNLTLAEMILSDSAKRNGISNKPAADHIENMKVLAEKIFQPIRDRFKKPIYISSGYRSTELNKIIKGSLSSQHCKGQAMDIDMDGTDIKNSDVFMFIKNTLNFDQLIWEYGNKDNPEWVHVSYNPSGKQRGEVLRAVRIGGKTVYQKF